MLLSYVIFWRFFAPSEHAAEPQQAAQANAPQQADRTADGPLPPHLDIAAGHAPPHHAAEPRTAAPHAPNPSGLQAFPSGDFATAEKPPDADPRRPATHRPPATAPLTAPRRPRFHRQDPAP